MNNIKALRCDFSYSLMNNTSLYNADCEGSLFVYSDLRYADGRKGNFKKTTFEGAGIYAFNLRDASIDPIKGQLVDFSPDFNGTDMGPIERILFPTKRLF
ncbi:MAG: hypothetical protein BWY64_01418 [bacterium ADurb.Bin363]|nr:MAG: hypothetical protein BWY64_01418 [bacterium ADurb.Bin363]